MKTLLIITTPVNIDKIKEEVNNPNKPFTRQHNILSKFDNIRNIKYVNEDFLSISKYIKDTDFVDMNYLEFLEYAYPSYAENLLENIDYVSPCDGGLVNYYFCKNNPDLQKLPYFLRCGFYTNDFYTSIFDHTYETSLRSAYNSLIAAKHVDKSTIIYCCNVLGGHHSTNNTYNGYCFLNNAAICAKILLQNYNKISILDIDFHHGDGTQYIFKDNDDVLTISIHGDPRKSYPFYTGYTVENNNSNYNFPLPKDTNIHKYLQILSDALEIILSHNSNVLIIPFGCDTFIDDPQGSFNIYPDDYKKIAALIKDKIKIPIIVTQEGGYDMEIIGTITKNFIESLL